MKPAANCKIADSFGVVRRNSEISEL